MAETGITYFDEENQEWLKCGPWLHQDSSTIGTSTTETISNLEGICVFTGSEFRLTDSIDLVSCAFGNVVSTTNINCDIKKLFWHKQPQRRISQWLSRIKNIVVGVPEDALGYSNDITVTMVPWHDTWEASESEIKIRGIFNPRPKRKILFSETLEIKTAKLPRWKPKTILGGRTIEE